MWACTDFSAFSSVVVAHETVVAASMGYTSFKFKNLSVLSASFGSTSSAFETLAEPLSWAWLSDSAVRTSREMGANITIGSGEKAFTRIWHFKIGAPASPFSRINLQLPQTYKPWSYSRQYEEVLPGWRIFSGEQWQRTQDLSSDDGFQQGPVYCRAAVYCRESEGLNCPHH